MLKLTRAAVCAVLLANAACATTEGLQTSEARSEIDRAVARCTMSVIGGALLGAVVGNNMGDGNARQGAAIGAAGGGVVCAVIMAAAREKAALIESQRAAVAAGMGGRTEIATKDGKIMVVTNRITDAPAPDVATAATDAIATEADTRQCRYAQSRVEFAGVGASEFGAQRFCKGADGVWALA